jgi:putative tricarboxylic transport membrane protein
MATSVRAACLLGLPLAAAAAAWLLGRYFIAPGVDDGMARGIVGPATWPKVMLYCAAACALALFLRGVVSVVRRSPPASAQDDAATGYHEGRSACAIALILAYGIAIPLIGMAWATAAFFAGWLLLGGVRRPLLLALVPIVGTVALLYLFAKVSLMPLDRGRGVFEQATVALYRVLGIY